MTQQAMVAPQEELFGHPKGLYVLFFTELWERFSYYGMRAILVLYILAEVKEGPNGGLGWDKASALALYGWYTMSVYVASIPGGLIADKLLGQRTTVMIGGLTLCAGHLILALHGIMMFYTGLALIIVGVGLLKPNISTMVGGLYQHGDPRRDAGFSIFYMGINLGALAAGLVVGSVAAKYGWHYGFGLAGIGMLAGQVVYIGGQRHLATVGGAPGKRTAAEDAHAQKPLNKEERDRMLVLVLSFVIVIVFWGAFEQAGGLMNIFTNDYTNRMVGTIEIPAAWFQSLNPAYIILFAVPIASFWIAWQKKGHQSSSLFKMAVGTIIMGWGFIFMAFATMEKNGGAKAWMGWIVLAYLFHTIGELCASPVALSFITKLAPLKYASLMMGAYFAASGFGNKLAGVIGEAAVGDAGEMAIFVGIAGFCTLFGIVILVLLKPLIKLTHGAEDLDEDFDASVPPNPEGAAGGEVSSTAVGGSLD